MRLYCFSIRDRKKPPLETEPIFCMVILPPANRAALRQQLQPSRTTSRPTFHLLAHSEIEQTSLFHSLLRVSKLSEVVCEKETMNNEYFW
jgi:hypothetical protein